MKEEKYVKLEKEKVFNLAVTGASILITGGFLSVVSESLGIAFTIIGAIIFIEAFCIRILSE